MKHNYLQYNSMIKMVCFWFVILFVSAIFSPCHAQCEVRFGVQNGCDESGFLVSEVLDFGAEVVSDGVAIVEVLSCKSVNIDEGSYARVGVVDAGECCGVVDGEGYEIANCLSVK